MFLTWCVKYSENHEKREPKTAIVSNLQVIAFLGISLHWFDCEYIASWQGILESCLSSWTWCWVSFSVSSCNIWKKLIICLVFLWISKEAVRVKFDCYRIMEKKRRNWCNTMIIQMDTLYHLYGAKWAKPVPTDLEDFLGRSIEFLRSRFTCDWVNHKFQESSERRLFPDTVHNGAGLVTSLLIWQWLMDPYIKNSSNKAA